VVKITFDSCVHPYKFVTERTALKGVNFMHNLAKTKTTGRRVVFSVDRVPGYQLGLHPHRITGVET
jgi:hypothetical protein